MKKILILFIVLCLLPALGACRTLGDKYLAGDWISVAMSKELLRSAPRHAGNFRKQHGVERLYRHIIERFDRYRIRRSLKFDVLVTDYYIGPGRDRLIADVVVTEHGEELDSFIVEETTGLHPIVKRLTKGLSKRITKRARRL